MARKRQVKYRLEINYLSKSYEDSACSTSAPIYTLADGWKAYKEALTEKCIDDTSAPARVHFWRYNWNESGKCCPITIAKNY